MIVTLRTQALQTLEQVRAFVAGTEPVSTKPGEVHAFPAFICRTDLSKSC